MNELITGVIKGERRAIARALTVVENERDGAEMLLAALFPHTGRAQIIGITGAPGTGKSTLVSALAKAYRAQQQTVAIIAVDPTSPFSGGAIMGDRIRMRDLAGDPGVFIRSMATRGNLGGLARASRDAIRVLDAAGFELILVETVGAGQSEVDIARTAQTTLVVEAPGLGDDVQAIKAGILEIADILVVNKADKPGADSTVSSLKAMLELGHPAAREQMVAHHGRILHVQNPAAAVEARFWLPPVLRTVASEGGGIPELMQAIAQHRAHLALDGALQSLEKQQIEIELHDRLRAALIARLLAIIPQEMLADMIARIQARTLDPHAAVQQLLAAQVSQYPDLR
ncbi:MAG: methylmalonyl Co-A mutase-associated GTPase MeaB [Chloroflexi bacterium]|nr:methylmalonyl Co-A mutase-associated GTPase MeaB [Chloroflexota bacterium]